MRISQWIYSKFQFIEQPGIEKAHDCIWRSGHKDDYSYQDLNLYVNIVEVHVNGTVAILS